MKMIQMLAVVLLCLPDAQAEAATAGASQPNVILFIADDVSWNDYGCYGNSAARTPNIDALAAGGLRFDRAILTASSCSPSRSSIITGRYPHNNGRAAELHQPISGHLPWFPEILRQHGYFTALSGKHHMTSTAPKDGPDARPTAFDHVDGGRAPGNSGGHANWVQVLKDRPTDKPFFCWFAAYDAHRDWDGDKQWNAVQFGPLHPPKDVIVPPFLADEAETRQDLASYYNEVTRFDHFIGQVVQELRRQQVLDTTLILVMADNGRPFPRAKTRLHDSGMKTGLVAHWPQGINSPGIVSSLVSAIDLAPTILEIAGCKAPETFQGVSLTPVFRDPSASVRQYAFSEHNWHDYEAHGRSVRNGNFLLVRNSRTALPWQGPADSVRSPSHKALLERQSAGTLTPAQADVFQAPRSDIELFDTASDPQQLTNLANDPKFSDVKSKLLAALNRWAEETHDSVPEKISPDGFDRRTGQRLPKSAVNSEGAITPGQDRNADHVNAPGPR
ncbi:MAG: sulfatase [Planctomycetaceae bacterium]|nr:sulfatase [Planctomycetaceae bacterium]